MKITRFEDIDAWRFARKLCCAVHAVTSQGAFAKAFALRDQIDRASGSVMDNIAEGFDGGSDAEFIRFMGYSQRSCSEVKSQLYRAIDRNFITQDEFTKLIDLCDHTHAQIGGFIRYLKRTKD